MQELYNLPKNLKSLRKQYGYTQSYVATQLGITCQSYQAYEWGITVPTLQNFIKLAKLFDVTYEELLAD
jgi:DNA-binding XRE family transcriptional regulator